MLNYKLNKISISAQGRTFSQRWFKNLVLELLVYFDLCSVLVCSDCHIKMPQLGWCKQHKCNIPHFWRLRAQSSMPTGLCSLRGWQRIFSRPLSLTYRWHSSSCVAGPYFSSSPVSVHLSSFHGLGVHSIAVWLHPNYICNDPIFIMRYCAFGHKYF